ncbi:MAG TPA: hypothetical protein PK867_30070, partial [Pirellulales bacterium]|nr:hypothetical protein [Pirellulales bacterium]
MRRGNSDAAGPELQPASRDLSSRLAVQYQCGLVPPIYADNLASHEQQDDPDLLGRWRAYRHSSPLCVLNVVNAQATARESGDGFIVLKGSTA